MMIALTTAKRTRTAEERVPSPTVRGSWSTRRRRAMLSHERYAARTEGMPDALYALHGRLTGSDGYVPSCIS